MQWRLPLAYPTPLPISACLPPALQYRRLLLKDSAALLQVEKELDHSVKVGGWVAGWLGGWVAGGECATGQVSPAWPSTAENESEE